MAKEHQWDVYLRPNVLTKDDENDCIADMANRIVAGVWANAGSPFDPAVHKRTVDLVPTAAFRDALTIIDGSRIKVDETDEAQGVFIVDSAGAEHKVTRRLSVNKPSQLIARVPADVPEGALKEIREVTYSGRCTAVKT